MKILKRHIEKNWFIILSAGVMLAGIFLRFYDLGKTSFSADEFLDLNSAYGYSQTGKWQAWNFNFEEIAKDKQFAPRDERAWPYKWQTAQLFKIFDPSEGVARSVSAFWGVIAIAATGWASYVFTRNKIIALLAMFLLAVSIDAIELSRTFRMYAMFSAVYLLFSLSIFRFLEEGYEGRNKFLKYVSSQWGINILYFIPAVVLGILSLMLHPLTANIAVVAVIYLSVKAFQKARAKSLNNKYVWLLSGVAVAVATAFLAFPEVLDMVTGELRFFRSNFSYLKLVAADYQSAFLFWGFLSLGIIHLLKNKERFNEGLWVSLSFMAPLTSAIFLWSRAGQQYIFFVQSFKIIIVAAGIYWLARFLKNNSARFGGKTFAAAVVVSLLLLSNCAYFWQENNVYRQDSRSENPNFQKIFSYIIKRRKPDEVLLTRNFRNYYWRYAEMKVIDFGGEIYDKKLTLSDIQKILNDNPHGWAVIADGDRIYVERSVVKYLDQKTNRIKSFDAEKVMVYRW